ncbi:hypothetical protein U1Q18_037610, partial [Sarracenia purpurea var. burkii]
RKGTSPVTLAIAATRVEGSQRAKATDLDAELSDVTHLLQKKAKTVPHIELDVNLGTEKEKSKEKDKGKEKVVEVPE